MTTSVLHIPACNTFLALMTFINNSAAFGGVISSFYDAVFSFSGISNFINNLASNRGGAICLVINNTMTYKEILHISYNKVERGLISY